MSEKNLMIRAACMGIFATLICVSLISAAVKVDTFALREAVTVDGIRAHQQAFQDIADADGGTRASGTPGYDESVSYVAGQLEGAGYEVSLQPFTYDLWEELSLPVLEQVSPIPTTYPPNDRAGFATMLYSGAGDVTAEVALADNYGCEPSDFDVADFTGNIALIERGVCEFWVKAQNAENAGAVGAIIFNDEARQDAFLGTLRGPFVAIPVVGSSWNVGQELAASDPTTVHMVVDSQMREISTSNVIAETPGGRDDRVVVVGAHLDSVPRGPGIQDNGSGSAAILEIALQMAELDIEPRNKVRFTWWGAKESGLIGSQYYVDSLSKRELKNIALYLNFDMIGSPNFVRFIYDGDGSDTPPAGPNGSNTIEKVFLDYFAEQGLATEPTAFDGRSDYAPFIAAGIPAGGLFTGADGIKTEEEAAIYGGTAGEQYDPCYHLACDTFDNISEEALDQMSDAAAHAVLTFAETTSSVNGTAKGKGLGKWKNSMEFRGSHVVK